MPFIEYNRLKKVQKINPKTVPFQLLLMKTIKRETVFE